MPMGRPTKLTAAVIAEVAELLPRVLYLATVADFIGVHPDVMRRWVRRGEKPEASEPLYREFATAYRKGLAEGELADLAVIRNAASGMATRTSRTTHADGRVTEVTVHAEPQWQAAAWRLERRFPERWSKDGPALRELVQDVKTLKGG